MRLLLAILFACAALLSGCGDDDDDDGGAGGGGGTGTTASGAEPASGAEISGNGRFTIALASGWKDGKDEADSGSIKPEVVLIGPADEDFAANVNVIREPAPKGVDLDDAGSTFKQQVTGLGGKNIRDIDAPQLDGEEARGHEFDRTQGSLEIVQRQVYTLHEDNLYTVTFTATKKAAPEQLKAFDAMLASWGWS